MKYTLGSKVIMKKGHPCGENLWEVIRLGVDIKLKCVNCGRTIMMDRIEFERNYQNSINRESKLLKVGDNLYHLSAGLNMPPLEQYKGYVIKEINPINDTVTFLNGEVISARDAVGDVSERDIRRIQIRETILSHFEKEEENFYKGIKTLSLFFIDEVAKYRKYDEDGNAKNGEYAEIFEKE